MKEFSTKMKIKKYDLFGMGNALVDLELEVSEAFLKEQGLKKGQTCLVDQETQYKILENTVGQHHQKSGGGSAANTIIGFSQYGGKSYYSCRVARDEFGEFYRQDLSSLGIDSSASAFVSENLESKRNNENTNTGRCLAMVTPDGERTMATYLGTSQEYSLEDLNLEALKLSSSLYCEGYLFFQEKAQGAIKKAFEVAKEEGIATCLTFSDPSVVTFCRENLLAFFKKQGPVDLLFGNLEEYSLFFENSLTLSSLGRNLEKLRENLAPYASNFVITLGGNGAIAFDRGVWTEIVATPVKPLDTIGAGDHFAAAYLYGRFKQWPMRQSLRLAHEGASLLVQQFGARLSLEQIQFLRTSYS